jgi:transposase-like protein
VSIIGLVGTIGVLRGQAGTSPVTTMQGARRSWSADEKRRIVEESLRPGASVAVVARRHDLNANLLFTWRRQVRTAEPAAGPPAVAAGRGGFPAAKRRDRQLPGRKPLPGHLPRETVVHEPPCACPACGDGDAELDEDGPLVGEIRFHGGDESAFKAHRW